MKEYSITVSVAVRAKDVDQAREIAGDVRKLLESQPEGFCWKLEWVEVDKVEEA